MAFLKHVSGWFCTTFFEIQRKFIWFFFFVCNFLSKTKSYLPVNLPKSSVTSGLRNPRILWMGEKSKSNIQSYAAVFICWKFCLSWLKWTGLPFKYKVSRPDVCGPRRSMVGNSTVQCIMWHTTTFVKNKATY